MRGLPSLLKRLDQLLYQPDIGRKKFVVRAPVHRGKVDDHVALPHELLQLIRVPEICGIEGDDLNPVPVETQVLGEMVSDEAGLPGDPNLQQTL